MSIKYYKLRGSRISLGEYWRLCPDIITFCIAAIATPFGGIAPAWAVPLLDTFPEIDPGELPRSVIRALDRHSERFEDEGYQQILYSKAPLLERGRLIASSILLSEDRWSLAQVLYIQTCERTEIGLTVGCFCEDGSYAAITNRKQELDSPPNHRVARYPGVDVARLVGRFQEHAQDWAEFDELQPIQLDKKIVKELLIQVERTNTEFLAARGILVPMTERDLERLGIDPNDLD
jgi:hypothetical protein